jgi:outer membrane immunogenic protein
MKNTKGFLLATAGGLATVTGAQAADLAVKAPPMPAPVASWTGFYLGLHAGGEWQAATADVGYAAAPDTTKGNGGGFIGGAQIGYNLQVSPMWVFGLEADISGLTGKATGNAGLDESKGNALESRINWLSTFRGRAGWLMNQNTMLYATGGLAVGGVKGMYDANGLHGDPFTTKSVSKTKAGWVVGGGMEHMLDNRWSLGVELLYVDLGHTTGTNIDGSKSSTFKNSAVIGQLKLNYKY